MRKRRRLANKMTIMVCAVLIAFSAFFYAPMNVEAEEISASVELNPVELSLKEFSQLDIPAVEVGKGQYYDGYVVFQTSAYDLIDRSSDMDAFYAVSVSGSLVSNASEPLYLRNSVLSYSTSTDFSPYLFFKSSPSSGYGSSQPSVFDFSTVVYGYGRDLVGKGSHFNSRTLGLNTSAVNFTFDFNINVDSVVKLTGEESASYQQGYNAGYSAGEQVGESNGYSNGYSDGYEAGEQSGYDSGYQAGSDSVDTQSYYDAGYSAGYDAGYLSGYDTGYDTGYDDGWSAYEAQMDKWGADTSDFPILVNEYTIDSFRNIASVSKPYPRDLVLNQWISLSHESNPNHTYKYVLQFDDLYMYRNSSADYVFSSDVTMDCDIGGTLYPIRADADSYDVYYVPGDRVSSTLEIIWILHNARVFDDDDIGEVGFQYNSLNVKVYDMGPSGDTQNHIANQTDQLTGGYNDSQGNSVNNDFSSGLNEFETAEDSLFATATIGLKDFTFFDFESVPAMVTGMSFVGSIMGSWFAQAGGASGVGIVLSILFSIMLVAMVLGLYRWYQSKGGKD